MPKSTFHKAAENLAQVRRNARRYRIERRVAVIPKDSAIWRDLKHAEDRFDREWNLVGESEGTP